MTDVTAPDVDAIRARLDAATPGPWVLDSHAHRVSNCRCTSCRQTSTVWQPGGLYCDDIPRDERDHADEGDRCDQFGYIYADAEFIAHAPEDIRALLDECARLREALALPVPDDGVGNDGLTGGERAVLTERYERGVGATPISSPERTERINRISDEDVS